MKRAATLILSFAVCACITAFAAQKEYPHPVGDGIVDIWGSAKIPGRGAEKVEYSRINDYGWTSEVSKAQLELFLPASNPKKSFVIVCPGGGYQGLALDSEGTEIADFLKRNNIAAGVLKYRTPNNREGALMDAQRAIRYVRANAEKLGIDKDKICIMGFSAGANLSARASTLYAQKTYEPVDKIDSEDAKPNLTALIYPAYCDDPVYQAHWGNKNAECGSDYNSVYKLAAELKVDQKTPSAFIIQSQNDNVWKNASIAYYLALKEAGVGAELHMFEVGGHGFGLRSTGLPVSNWGKLLLVWLNFKGFAAYTL